MSWKDGLKSATTALGGQCVRISGTVLILQLSADN